MQVSVIIPTYQHRDFVLQTLDSVFAQTLQDYEVIVVNDGSPDDTAQVLLPLAEQGKIRYIEQPNAGQAAARNRGLEEATGEFIAFLDDDDLWPADKLEWQVAALQANPEIGVVAGSVQSIDEQGRDREDSPEHVFRNKLYASPVSFEGLFYGNPIVSPGQTLIRASPLREIGGFDQTFWGVDDYDLWFRLARKVKFLLSPRLGIYYRCHANNASKDVSKMQKNTINLFQTQIASAPTNKRALLSRLAQRQLYTWMGAQAIARLRVRKLNPLSLAIQDIRQFSHFLRPALRDPALMKMMIHDSIPHFLKSGKRQTR